MSSIAVKEETPRRVVRRAPAAEKPRSRAVAQAKIVREAKKLFRARLAEASVKMPKVAADVTMHAFETTLFETMSRLIKDMADHPGPRVKDRSRIPTPRLRRTIANTEAITKPRFKTADALFASLEKRGKR